MTRGAVAVFLSYLAIFGGILVYSDFLPFTLDNNESFSAYWHARNMHAYGVAKSSGLADEAFSYDAAAHPYVYTHAGASPRLFAYGLYCLGVRTVEGQIAVTVFTIGLLGLGLAYRFLAEVATRRYAMVACLLLMTDYLLFAQWHVGIWHTWKTFLLFGGLYLALRVADGRQWRPLVMVFVFHAYLFYYETIFNVYVAAAVFLFFTACTRDYRVALRFGLTQLAGALTAAAVLFAQIVARFGWDVVRGDIYYTFVGRNFASDPAGLLDAATAFYARHNIVFWPNVPDSGQYRTLAWTMRVLFQDHAVHTPPWSLVVLAFAAAEIVRRLRGAGAPSPSSIFSSAGKLAAVPAAFLLGALSAAVFDLLARHPEIGLGLPLRSLGSILESAPVIVAGGILFAGAVFLAPPRLPVARILGASGFVAAVLAFLLAQPTLYGPGHEPVWRAALTAVGGYASGGALVVSVMLVLAAWYSVGPGLPTGGWLTSRLLLALSALFVAYGLVYFVFTGYVRTGYFLRYLPLTVFLNDMLLAVGLVAMLECARGWYASFARSFAWRRIAYGGGAALVAFGLVVITAYWGTLQIFLFRKLPPDSISFLPVLSKPPFRGSTFAGLAYGGVVAYFTKNWAYFDANSALAEGRVTLGPDGYRVGQDTTYVWFADRAVNPAYVKPQYFMTMTYQNPGLDFLTEGGAARRPRAGDVPLIRAIREGRTSYLHPLEVARDPSPLDRWSIVRLDWDFPPFLQPVENGELVALHVSSTAKDTLIRVDYRYAHQEGAPEHGTRLALFAQSGCAGRSEAASLPLLETGGREFRLPPSFAGAVRAEVQPATATKLGPIYASRLRQIGPAPVCPDAPSSPPTVSLQAAPR